MSRVLLVEDDRDTRRLVERWLRHDGHVVDEARSGEEALERLAEDTGPRDVETHAWLTKPLDRELFRQTVEAALERRGHA